MCTLTPHGCGVHYYNIMYIQFSLTGIILRNILHGEQSLEGYGTPTLILSLTKLSVQYSEVIAQYVRKSNALTTEICFDQ